MGATWPMTISFLCPTQVTDHPRTESMGPLRRVPLDRSCFKVALALPLGVVPIPGYEGLALFQINLDYPDRPDTKLSSRGVT